MDSRYPGLLFGVATAVAILISSAVIFSAVIFSAVQSALMADHGLVTPGRRKLRRRSE